MTREERRSLKRNLDRLTGPKDQHTATVLTGLRDAIRRGGQPGEFSIAASLSALENVAIKQKVDGAIGAELTKLNGHDGDLALYFLAEEKLAASNALPNTAHQELACRALLEILTLPDQGPAPSGVSTNRFEERVNRLREFNPAQFVQDWKAARDSVETHLGLLEERVLATSHASMADRFQEILNMNDKPQRQLDDFTGMANLLEHVHTNVSQMARGARRINVDFALFDNLRPGMPSEAPSRPGARTSAAMNTPRQPGNRSPRVSLPHGEGSAARGASPDSATPALEHGGSGNPIDQSAVFAAYGHLFNKEIQPR
ncbi:hypothetical protein [Noviherbaspirillum sp.]|uniref:hypothetical protein n=1 Tax=Noviherbaspirillum sp. TaxID=1926288 RepID=UPI002FE2EAB3